MPNCPGTAESMWLLDKMSVLLGIIKHLSSNGKDSIGFGCMRTSGSVIEAAACFCVF